MIANAWGPDAFSVLRFVEGIVRVLLKCMTYYCPVHQVFRVQNRQTGDAGEARGSHIIIIADTNNVRVGIIRVKDGIFIRAVFII